MIDIGANLAHESFAADLDAVLARAWNAGLSHIVLTGSDRASNRAVAAMAARDAARLSCTAGVHPHHASDWNADDATLIRELAAKAQVVSLGECGLDYHRDLSPRAIQRRAFAEQLTLAAELGKPVFLHQRSAHEDFYAILREHRPQLVAACVHCFTDTREAMEAYIELDCFIGITGWACDEKRGAPLRSVVPHIPEAQLLVETDAPYLLPRNLPRALRPGQRDPNQPATHPVDGRRNEPAFLPWVIAALAELRACEATALGASTAANARRFFRLPAVA